MSQKHATLFITHRGERHQQDALGAAPAELEVTMLRSPTKEEIMAALPGKEFLITERTGVIDADIIQAGKDLRLIQRLGSQTYDIDLKAAKIAGIPVCYLPVRSCIMVAEHMALQILALAKRLREVMDLTAEANDFGHPPRLCDEDYFAYNWTGRENLLGLWESTVGILGFGEIGTELAGVYMDTAVIFSTTNAIACHRKLNKNCTSNMQAWMNYWKRAISCAC